MNKLLITALLSVFFVGCASKNLDYPRATMHPYSAQQKMQAAAHWDLLAANEAKLISSKLSGSPLIHISCKSSGCGEGSANNSPFAEAYREFLTSHLVNNGASVAIQRESGAYELEYHVQVVTHNDRDGLPWKPGALSGTSALAFAIYKATHDFSNSAQIVLPLAILGDLALYNAVETSASNTEVLVTTKITKGNRVITSNSSVYYFNAGDEGHYRNAVKSIAVTNVN